MSSHAELPVEGCGKEEVETKSKYRAAIENTNNTNESKIQTHTTKQSKVEIETEDCVEENLTCSRENEKKNGEEVKIGENGNTLS